jgi:hypothetical protein
MQTGCRAVFVSYTLGIFFFFLFAKLFFPLRVENSVENVKKSPDCPLFSADGPVETSVFHISVKKWVLRKVLIP